jgi:beta-lactamase regulating signal transducer with metallopeptidase domain
MKEILITSSVLIGVVLLVRWAFRGKVSQKLIYATWLLVALRLLVPIQFGQSVYSITALTEKIESQSKPIQQVQEVLDQPVSGPSRAEIYQQLLDEYIQQNPDPVQPDAAPQVTPEVQAQIEAQTNQLVAPSLSDVLTAIWFVGMSAMAGWFLTANVIFLRRAKEDSTPLPGSEHKTPIRISPNVPTPCLVGLFRPVIYLTPASIENEQSRNHVLTHELTHLRHGDHIWAMVRCLCLCIYWFNPLVWIAASQSRRDCELACDESVLKKLGEHERIAYGQTLLATVTQSITPSQLIKTATAMTETKKQLKERIRFIAKKPRSLLTASIGMILIAAITAGCAFVSAKSPTIINTASSAKPGYKIVYLLTEINRFASDGELYDTITYTYNDLGQVIEKNCINYFSDSFSQKTTYTLNQHGHITYQQSVSSFGVDSSSYSYVYNDDGTISSYRYTDGMRYVDSSYEYDHLGRLIHNTKKYSYHKGVDHNYCFYDADGRLYKVIRQLTSSTSTHYFFYDNQGRLSRYQCEGGTIDDVSFEYDSNGNLIRKSHFSLLQADKIYSYTQGVLSNIEHVIDPLNAAEIPRSYTLDDHGNMTRIQWSNGKHTDYKYTAVELPDQYADPLLRQTSINGEATTIADFYADISLLFVPRTAPSIETSENLR